MRADRLVGIVMLLQGRGRMSVADLAAEVEVSTRTVLRDIEAIGIAGIPIRTVPGPGGGVELPPTYRSGLSALSTPEVRALLLTGSSTLLGEIGHGDALGQAQRKLFGQMTLEQRADADRWRSRVLLDDSAWTPGGPSAGTLDALLDAVWSEHRLELDYRPPSGEPGTRLVDPFGLVAKAGAWYLVARRVGPSGSPEAGDADLRSYRVSRVLAVRPTGSPAERPAGFDLAAAWHRLNVATRDAWSGVEVAIRLAPDARALITAAFGENALDDVPSGTVDVDGWSRTTVRLPSVEIAVSRLLTFGGAVEVLAPREVRAGVVREARRLLAVHGSVSEA